MASRVVAPRLSATTSDKQSSSRLAAGPHRVVTGAGCHAVAASGSRLSVPVARSRDAARTGCRLVRGCLRPVVELRLSSAGVTALVVVGALVEAGGDREAGGVGRTDQADDRLQQDERLAASVHRDVTDEAVLDPVPLRGARRRVTDSDLRAGVAFEPLQIDLPEAHTVAA